MELFRKYAVICILLANWHMSIMVNVNGLECDNCLRWGNLGSSFCVRMPCNNWKDVENSAGKLDLILSNITGEKEEDYMNDNLEDFAKYGVNGETNCVKLLVRDSIMIDQHEIVAPPITVARCDFVDPAVPPRPAPYDLYLRRKMFNNSGDSGNGARDHRMVSVYVCDEKLKGNCRVSHELNRSGVSRPLGTTSVIMITCFVLATLVGVAAQIQNLI